MVEESVLTKGASGTIMSFLGYLGETELQPLRTVANPGRTTLSASVIFMVATRNSGLEEQMAVVTSNLGGGHEAILLGQQLVLTCDRPSHLWKKVRKGQDRSHRECGKHVRVQWGRGARKAPS